jgi:metal-dependent amidase/aminoacylase/carboxypeptidase family protein
MGAIHGGTARNIVPNRAQLLGTVRSAHCTLKCETVAETVLARRKVRSSPCSRARIRILGTKNCS